MNFTVGRPKLRAQIAASCRNAYLSIAFAPQALPNADKNGVSSPPRWIRSNKNPFRQNRHLCNAQVQSLLYQAVCRKMTKNVKVLLDSFLVDKKSPLSPLQKFDSINRSDLWLYDYVYIIAHVYIIYIYVYMYDIVAAFRKVIITCLSSPSTAHHLLKSACARGCFQSSCNHGSKNPVPGWVEATKETAAPRISTWGMIKYCPTRNPNTNT